MSFNLRAVQEKVGAPLVLVVCRLYVLFLVELGRGELIDVWSQHWGHVRRHDLLIEWSHHSPALDERLGHIG